MARTFIEKIAQKMRIIPDLDREHSSGTTEQLRKYPSPDKWHDHVELDAQEWPKMVWFQPLASIASQHVVCWPMSTRTVGK